MTNKNKMRAVWLADNTLSVRRDIPIPRPHRGEALVKVHLAGICGTDIELLKGYYPFAGIPGHEFVGEIVRAPDRPEKVGQRVVGEINVVCGSCAQCLAGRSGHCEQRRILGIAKLNGAFAEYLCLPLTNLIPVPDTVSHDMAVFVEPLAAALEIQEQIQINATDRVLLIGAGRLGQLIAQTLMLTGCRLQVVVRHEKQRVLLAKRGIQCINESAVPGHCFDVVIEASGAAVGFASARKAVRPRGTIVVKSTYRGSIQVNLSSLVVDEITLVGSRCGPFAPALQLIKNDMVDPTDLIDGRYFLDQIQTAFRRAAEPAALKVLLQISQ